MRLIKIPYQPTSVSSGYCTEFVAANQESSLVGKHQTKTHRPLQIDAFRCGNRLSVDRLEHEDRVDTEGGLVVTFIQSGQQVVVPIPADFWTDDDIGVWLVVHAKGQSVNV